MWPVVESLRDGRGRCLVAARDIGAGETVLSERPAVLFVQPEFAESVCACCLRVIGAEAQHGCEACRSCRFCSADCARLAAFDGGAHTREVCTGLQQLSRVQGLDAEAQHLGRFVLQAFGVKAAGAALAQEAARYSGLLGLASSAQGPSAFDVELAAALLPVVSAAFVSMQRLPPTDVSVTEIATLLSKEAANGFCVMAPSAADDRLVRGTGVYLQASRFNHGCFPNVARFDYFDTPGADNSLFHFRAIDPIAAGTELLVSYFPVTMSRAQRQERLISEYGFLCRCERCELEACAATSCPVEAEEAAMDDSEGGESWERGGEGYSPEYALWFLKNVCPRAGCGGTLAPPTTTATVMECNFCGHLRTDAEFYAELGVSEMM